MRYREWAACAVNPSDTRLMTASTITSIDALTPNPGRADREVDGEGGGDADEVRQQVEQAEPGEHGDGGDVDDERADRDQVERQEPPGRQPAPRCRAAPAERPQLVQHVVV